MDLSSLCEREACIEEVGLSVLGPQLFEGAGVGLDQEPRPVALDLEEEAVAEDLAAVSPALDVEAPSLLFEDLVHHQGLADLAIKVEGGLQRTMTI